MDHKRLYGKIFKIIGNETPLKADCGKVCDCACCKGDENTGMLLFPYEETELLVKTTDEGNRLAVCNGTCDRSKRPLACRIFPFQITVNEKNRTFVELDQRGRGICPLITLRDQVAFNKKFISRLKKVGKLLKKDEKILEFLKKQTEETDQILKLVGEK
ncbi:MAG: hypothetical protein IKM06_06105 [Clostridia bacterium]|nr:hypothetical protein [Clostridia bacterium]